MPANPDEFTPPMNRPVQAVLFDLDGTLIDTAPDFAAVLNRMRALHGLDPLPYEAVRAVVSDGARALITLGFGAEEGEPAFEPLRAQLLELYGRHLADASCLFPGMKEVLAWLQAQGLAWGVVTNKPLQYADALMRALALERHCSALICPDHVRQRKPHPEGLLLACEQIGCAASGAVYVGDHLRDIEAGHNAGMATVACRYGYLREPGEPDRWGAHAVVDTASDLLDWLREHTHSMSSPRRDAIDPRV